jgi:imidazolonepropionase-like amidohydrolase
LDDLPMSYDQLGARRDNAARLAQAGVTIAFSVSAQGIYRSYNAGPAIREGAGVAVANGLPYLAALKAITLGPAQIWGIEKRAGSLAPGTDADLVIWDGDPLEPTTAPTLVMIAGREIPLVTRQTLLRDRYAPSNRSAPAGKSSASP